ncbi:hypothetical protein [Ideonella paludis]|uniref:hypothetical protein n=1 Tax=Ideonella paludis TaxID=1233411 RepID=UPI0036250765
MSLLTRTLAAALPLLALSACQTIYPVPNVEFPTATAPAMPASGPLVMAAYEPMAVPTPPPPPSQAPSTPLPPTAPCSRTTAHAMSATH